MCGCPTLLSKAEIVNVVYDFSGRRRRRVADSVMTGKTGGGWLSGGAIFW